MNDSADQGEKCGGVQVGCEGVEVCRWGVRCGGVQVGWMV